VPDALLVTSSFLPGRGGIESYLAELCDELSPRLAVLAPATRDGRPIPKGLPYPVRGASTSMLRPGRAVADAVIDAAREHGTKRILFGTPWPLVLIGPRLHAAGLRYAAIVHGAELVVPAAVPGLASLLARSLRRADLLFAVSDFTAGRVRKAVGARAPRVDLLRARVNVDRFTPHADGASARRRLGIAADAPLVLCFGRLVARKGVDRLIDAMPAVAHAIPGAVLVIAGTGPELDALRRRAARTDAAIVFAGRVPEEEAPQVYAAASVFALPVADRWFGLEVEGLGVVLVEAAASGVPCVTGASGGTGEAVRDGRTGFVVDGRDPTALEDRIIRLLEDPATARTMGAAGREYVSEVFANRALPASLQEWLG
jgi:phosphatidyl-myo-inositol dimannoside synthase